MAFPNGAAKATTVLAAMATAAMAAGIAYFIFLRSERRLERMDAAAVEQQVAQAYDRMIAAAESLKLDELFAGLMESDTAALIVNGRLLQTRAAVMERTRRNFQGISALKYHVAGRHVTMLSPTVALLIETGTNDVQTEDGRKISGEFAHTVVLVLEAGRWRVLHTHQSTPLPR